MLVDEVEITIKAGNGGNGAVSFRRNAQTPRGGPDGGNGGNGGNVFFQGTSDIEALAQFRYKKSWKAEDGIAGAKNNLYGRNGKDLILQIPFGTQVTDFSRDVMYEVVNEKTNLIMAKGGKGGRGNNEFKSATNQAPRVAEKGESGEEKILRLTLKLIADIGLIGLPNAGKSSLLDALTNAHPKIGNYPFTTLEPNLGVFEGLVLADIPGLIEGASSGKGLGVKFLKHVEKTSVLLHCIDATTEHPEQAYQLVREELRQYNAEMLQKPEIILLTKSDLTDPKDLVKKQKKLQKLKKEIIPLSVYDDESLTVLHSILKKQKATRHQ